MAEGELEVLETQLRDCKGLPPADSLQSYMRLVRELRIRDSPSVARYGQLLLRHYKGRLADDELWTVQEQVAIAALDSGATAFAASLIRNVNKRFPNSVRAKRLQGMYYEAIGDLGKAEDIYTSLADQFPHNEYVLKRLVALERTRGNVPALIEALKKYLEVYQSDGDAWEELADVYLEQGMYKQAAYCLEELVMINPGHSNYLVRYADTLYTIGGASNYKVARSYYSKVLEATAGGSLRALFGILACTANLPEKVSVQDARSRAQIELPDLTASAVMRIYRKEASDKMALAQGTLKKMGFM